MVTEQNRSRDGWVNTGVCIQAPARGDVRMGLFIFNAGPAERENLGPHDCWGLRCREPTDLGGTCVWPRPFGPRHHTDQKR